LNGLRSEATFYKGVLDKLGIEADLYHIGKYKSASEVVTREGMSDAHRESLNSLLDDLYNQMVSGIAEGRGISRSAVMKRIDEGPYTAKEAMDAGLVDELVYADQLGEVAEQTFGAKAERLPGKQYGSYKYHRYDWDTKPKLAVIYATGMIALGRGTGGQIQDSPLLRIPRIMGSETIPVPSGKPERTTPLKQ
jgi:protease-4